MKLTAFPITIIVENKFGDILFEQKCTSLQMLQKAYIRFISLHQTDFNYSVYFHCNSKVNDKIKKILNEFDY